MEATASGRRGTGRARALVALLATPRWIGWTVLAALAVAVCAVMAHWQFVRAESPGGSLLNAGYAVQWPVFGLFFAALWWRMLSAEARILAGIVPGPTRPEGPDDDRAPVADPATPAFHDPADPAAGPSPFTPRPAGVVPGQGQGAPARDRARADYNAMLAALAHSEQHPGDPSEPSDPSRRTE